MLEEKTAETELEPDEKIDPKRKRGGESKEKPRHTQKSRKAKKKDGFPVGGLILSLVLIAAILIAGYLGFQYYEEYSALVNDYETSVQTAESELAAAEAEFAEADPESAAHVAERQQLSAEMIAAAQSEIDELQEKVDQLDDAIRETEDTISEYKSVEGYDYYKAIYDEYVEGRAYIEELLSGN